MYPWIAVFTLVSILMITYRDAISTLFSGDSDAKYLEEDAMVYSSIFVFLTCTKMLIQSPFAAMKRQTLILTTSIIDFFIIGLPLSALLAFNLGMSVSGLFLGGCFGTVVGTAIQIGHLSRIDVAKEAENTQIRIKEEKKILMALVKSEAKAKRGGDSEDLIEREPLLKDDIEVNPDAKHGKKASFDAARLETIKDESKHSRQSSLEYMKDQPL